MIQYFTWMGITFPC